MSEIREYGGQKYRITRASEIDPRPDYANGNNALITPQTYPLWHVDPQASDGGPKLVIAWRHELNTGGEIISRPIIKHHGSNVGQAGTHGYDLFTDEGEATTAARKYDQKNYERATAP